MKILIVAAYFPPYNTIGALRPYSWAKYWRKAGHEISVLTISKEKLASDLNYDLSDFNIISVSIPFLKKPEGVPGKELRSKKNSFYLTILNLIKNKTAKFREKTGCFTSRFPSFYDLWAMNAYRFVKSSSFDIVVSTGSPYSVHRIGFALKKKNHNIKWVIDWRDLWTYSHLYNGLRIFWSYERYLENKFHKNADLIITISEPLADILRDITKTKVETIYNGFDPDDYGKIRQKPRKNNQIFTIIYTGSIYKGYRDISPLFEAVSNLKEKNILTERDLKILFAGMNADVSDIAEKYNVSEFYSYLGFLPREETLQRQYDADAVLFLEYNNPAAPGILTGKLFEYLYIAREIIAIEVDESTASGKLIESTASGKLMGKNIKKIEEYLMERIIQKAEKVDRKNMDVISHFSREIQAQKLLSYFDGYEKK